VPLFSWKKILPEAPATMIDKDIPNQFIKFLTFVFHKLHTYGEKMPIWIHNIEKGVHDAFM
jgi:hypothetical protein